MDWMKTVCRRWHIVINYRAKSKRKTKEEMERGFWGRK
jgi:hypothetical protein